jgi:hypothetical protein
LRDILWEIVQWWGSKQWEQTRRDEPWQALRWSKHLFCAHYPNQDRTEHQETENKLQETMSVGDRRDNEHLLRGGEKKMMWGHLAKGMHNNV